MRLLVILAVSVLVAVVARAADAADKAPKPSVCLSYTLIPASQAQSGRAFAICHDGEKPALFYRFAEVVVPGKEGGSVKALVGWR